MTRSSTDIVARLREFGAYQRTTTMELAVICREAANEIERLRGVAQISTEPMYAAYIPPSWGQLVQLLLRAMDTSPRSENAAALAERMATGVLALSPPAPAQASADLAAHWKERHDVVLQRHLECCGVVATLVREWRDAQRAIDQLTPEQRRATREPLNRMIAAHNALLKYANEELGE